MIVFIFNFYKNHSIKRFSSLVEKLRKEEKYYAKSREFRTS